VKEKKKKKDSSTEPRIRKTQWKKKDEKRLEKQFPLLYWFTYLCCELQQQLLQR